MRDYQDADRDLIYDEGEHGNWTDHHDADSTNQISHRKYNEYDGSVTLVDAVVTDIYYDDAGNLVLHDVRFYIYDAWNGVVEVKELE